MDHRFHHQQSMSDRARYGGGFARRAHVEGNGKFINKMKGSKIVSDSIRDNGSPVGHMVTFDSRQNSSRRASGTLIKLPTHEEMSREKKVREPSPSVIAKLMGLDSLPPPQAVSKQQENRSLPKTTSTSYQGHSVAGKSTREHQEFKDVFEINDSTKFEIHSKQYERRKSQPAFKGNSCMKENDTDLAFIRQKFMEAKRLSTDENLQNSKELNDALEVLDSNRDLLIKFLEEPSSLSTKQLQDWKNFPPAPHESHITVLKSSKGKRFEIDDMSRKPQVKTEKCAQMQKDPLSSLRKPTTNLFNHSLQEHSGSLSHKLLKSRSAGTNYRSTRIVVLKPNLGKAQDMARNVSRQRSRENNPFGYRKQQEVPHSVFHELHVEGMERQNLFDNVDVMGQRTKGSREIAREIAKQTRHSISTGSRKMLGSGFNRYIKDEMYIVNNSGAYRRTPENFESWNITSSPSTSCSTELSLSREARKRLSERWIMTHRLQQERIAGLSTLGEMLAQDSSTAQKISDEKPNFYQHGITSGDGWKDDCSTNLPKSSSFPVSSTVQCTPKVSRHQVSDMFKDVLNLGVVNLCDGSLNQRRSSSHKRFKVQNYKPHLNSGGEENKLPVKEIHMNQEELRNGIHVTDRSEVKPILYKFSDSNMFNPRSAVMESENVERPFVACEGHIPQPEQEEYSAIVYVGDAIMDNSLDYPEETGSEPLINSKESEQPSPASVLDHPSEECQSSPESFEKVNADLQELRLQLQLLWVESDAYNTECETPVLSEDGAKECFSPIQKLKTPQYRNEEDRDYSYLQNSLQLNTTLDLDVFEKLEEKYAVLTEWSKCERKLLFDLSSSILEEIQRKPKRNFGHEELSEEVWKMLVRLRKVLGRGKLEETILDPRWLDLGDDVDIIGRDIAGMLEDDLLEELVSEFVLNQLELVR